MQIITLDTIEQKEKLYQSLLNRTAFAPEIEQSVAEIIDDIKSRGNQALIDCAARFDHATLTEDQFLVSQEEINEALDTLPIEDVEVIKRTIENIRAYSEVCLPQSWEKELRPGVVLGERFSPLQRVAFYIPGGTAPLVSTVMHTVVIGKVAGVSELVVITPPGANGKVNPAILVAAHLAGATEIYRLGGVYGVAAMALGTETIAKVDKIVGPGNAYVTAAKRQMYGFCDIDMVAGPSEILIMADESANPAFIAADLLSQAEHGSGREQAVLVTTDPQLPNTVHEELLRQMALLTRQATTQRVYENGIFMVVVSNEEEMVELANRYAPEHLEIHCVHCEALAKQITCAGAIFIGEYSPEPFGDFVAGPSHVLPTGGSAAFFSGLSTAQFFRRISTIRASKAGLQSGLEDLKRIANMEGLDAHRRSAEIRFE